MISSYSKSTNTEAIERVLKKSRKTTPASSSSSSSSMAIDWSSSDWEGKSGSHGVGGGGNGVDARERHKLAERERRKSMRELFLSLHSLLPHANTVRKEQSAILDEIIKYIPIAAARLRSLQNRKDNSSNSSNHSSLTSSASSSKLSSTILSKTKSKSKSYSSVPSVQVSDRDNKNNNKNSATSAVASTIIDCDIRVAPEPSSSVAIRIRGDRVNVSLSDSKGTSHTLLLSAVLDELENHQLELVRSTHCRDGSKVLHHSESKICDGLDKSPNLLKSKLQELARKLHKLRKSTSLKRTFDQIE
ncbi:hypothetical protein MKW98_009047 [Papaver atlanticum]|uniref:BHLH domain-containing protein n=1 Tax=Papaver atlanticum TaxID=357466 RepID=A0AAD4RX67_9MAGN|nr:hypothetical protein MKW98_009047 [Papaver atlanticum]